MKSTLIILVALLWPYTISATFSTDTSCVKQYNLDHYNGLPSDHVYCMLTDRHGYLYIGTDKGVVRYNGYTFKKFDMPDPDVWDIYEDKKGRVWLFRTSDELGYIYNDRYHKVYVKQPYPMPYVYARYPREYPGGMFFLQFGTLGGAYLRIEYNDTLYTYNTGLSGNEGNMFFISSDNKIYISSVYGLYQVYLNGLRAAIIKKCSKNTSSRVAMLNNHLVLNTKDTISLLNTANCSEYKVKLDKGEFINNTYHNKQKAFIVTNKSVYSIDANKLIKYDLCNYLTQTQIDNSRAVYMLQDSFWNTCVGTNRSGIFMTIPSPALEKITEDDMASFRYVGSDNYKTLYWWNNEKKKLALLKQNGNLAYIPLTTLSEIRKVIPYRGDEMILMTRFGFYTLNTGTLKIKNIFKRSGPYHYYHLKTTTGNKVAKNSTGSETGFQNGVDGLYINDKLTAITKGWAYTDFRYKSDSLIQVVYYTGKFGGLAYDSSLKTFILHTDKDIIIHRDDNSHELKNVVNKLGIKRIYNIQIDQKHKNLFIQDHDRIVAYNYSSGNKKNILEEYKLKNTRIHVHDNTLIVAGSFGIMFCKISGPLEISSPVFFPNIKNTVYRDVSDLAARDGKAIINTDNGLFTLDIPDFTKATYQTNHTGKYKFVVNYNDTQHVVNAGDTLTIEQENASLLFDIIKPTGLGTPRFKTHIQNIDSAWQDMNANELVLTKAAVGVYYQLMIAAEDEVWKSRPIKIVICLRPYWWQTTIARRLIFTLSIIAITLVIFLIIHYTRKIAVKSHIRKNHLLSLELKSIYAQINPHFIFNTLNTGLFFISENKNKEAFAHISSFSELLRSYIKSARNKYITLAEEITNIEHYIKLQQNRFEDRFEYRISVADDIQTNQKHIPAMLLQPFVENAIHHGFLHKKTKGNLEIKIISGLDKKTIICTIDDDGIGRERSKKIYASANNKPTSYGNDLIQDLIKIINADNKLRVSIQYTDLPEPLVTTRVIITIKELGHE